MKEIIKNIKVIASLVLLLVFVNVCSYYMEKENAEDSAKLEKALKEDIYLKICLASFEKKPFNNEKREMGRYREHSNNWYSKAIEDYYKYETI